MAQEEGIEMIHKDYRHIFDKYADGGVPLRELRSQLDGAGLTQHVPRRVMSQLMRRADADHSGTINYSEFQQLMNTEEMNMSDQNQMSRFQRFIRASVSTVVPRSQLDKKGDYVVQSYVDHYTCKPPPLFIPLISIAELVVLIIYAVELNGTKYAYTATGGCPFYSPFIFSPYRRYEAWRYLGYMLIHQGYLHFVFNLFFQLVLGIPLEMVHKWWRVGVVYLLGVIAGSLAHTIFDQTSFLAGASGGCYSLIGAHFAIIIMNWKEMTHDWMSGPVKFIMSAPFRLFIFTSIGGIDIGVAIWKFYSGDADGMKVGYAAHFGGFLAGILIGIPVLKNIDEKPWERVLWWVALVVYLVVATFAIAWNAFYPGFPKQDWRPCCPFPK